MPTSFITCQRTDPCTKRPSTYRNTLHKREASAPERHDGGPATACDPTSPLSGDVDGADSVGVGISVGDETTPRADEDNDPLHLKETGQGSRRELGVVSIFLCSNRRPASSLCDAMLIESSRDSTYAAFPVSSASPLSPSACSGFAGDVIAKH